MKQPKTKVCVVIPTMNEGTVIRSVVEGVSKAFKETLYDVSVVVIDDTSHDNTVSEAKKGGAKVISHIIHTGAGGGTATGLSYAYQNGFDLACTMDGDGQHDPNDVVEGVKQLLKKDVDLLIGSRLINNEGMSKVKVLGNKGLSLITYLLFGINSTDSQSGLRIFSKVALEKLKWRTSGYEFCSEMLWRAKQINLRIDEYPIRSIYTDYSKAKGQSNWNAINIIKSLLQRRITELLG